MRLRGSAGGGDTGGGGDTRVVGEALLDFLVGLRLLRGLLEVDGGGGHGLCGRGGLQWLCAKSIYVVV